MIANILFIEDEPSIREAFSIKLSEKGYLVQTARNGEEGIGMLKKFNPDILILDMVMAGMSGLDVLKEVRSQDSEIPVVVLTARGTVKDAVEAMRLGAFDFVTKSIDMDELLLSLANATRFLSLSREARYWTGKESERYALEHMVAESETSLHLKKQVRDLASNDQVTVLLQGETGSGKEYVSKVLHYNGPLGNRPFIEVDCPAIPSELFESELFGYEKGSFTGASGKKVGLIELADGGTVLLDEIGDLPLPLQAKLLRVIEERTIRRVGGGAQFPVNVRFMAATHRDLRQAVKNGTFREDLFYRLNVVVLPIPPLRERRKDIIPISEKFLYKSAQIFRKKIHRISPSAKQLLISYDFPGNIRELSNLIERAVLYCSGTQLECEHFPAELQCKKNISGEDKSSEKHSDQQELAIPFRIGADSLESHERELIAKVLAHSNGKKTMAAKFLGISRWALDRRIKEGG
ncbi:sigma-54-dependent transcriptional regulator [Leptospirillum ferrooxidans]|uniref:Two component, sigma-54 specific, transcriptional regulator, Fis family n=2 Tax=root TaxID=1 RepID=I0IMI7_LEPFC|nr:sigma-54 dependent transcriptional regulator [Leptospirillum ferrooxidans]BAM06486.1 two component, sigma-54 specific, transcriptional regulator, Fis family [Leptospirillum ferrooxidans C2-3]